MEEKFIGEEYMAGISCASPFIVDGKVIGKPFNLIETINRFGKEIIPNELGIYHLFYNDQLIYIGMSRNIRGRLLGHLKDKDMPFSHCLWFCASIYDENATVSDILRIEYKMIKKFKPVLNSVYANCR